MSANKALHRKNLPSLRYGNFSDELRRWAYQQRSAIVNVVTKISAAALVLISSNTYAEFTPSTSNMPDVGRTMMVGFGATKCGDLLKKTADKDIHLPQKSEITEIWAEGLINGIIFSQGQNKVVPSPRVTNAHEATAKAQVFCLKFPTFPIGRALLTVIYDPEWSPDE